MNTQLQFLIYNTPDTQGSVQVYIKDETLWATQKAIADLYNVSTSTISRHLRNIYNEGELEESSTIAKNAIVVKRGFRGDVNRILPSL